MQKQRAQTLPPDMLTLTDEDVRAAFDWREAIAALEKAYATADLTGMFPPRSVARGEGVWLRALTGILPEQGVMGAKMIAASPAGKKVSYLLFLFDLETMAIVAMLDGNAITGFRTGATSAIAARRLCAERAPRVAVIGSGFEARTHLEALARSGELAVATVFSPRETSRIAFCEAMAEKGISAAPAPSAEAAVAEADLVICAARSRDETPTFRGSWLRPGMTLLSIGSTLPEQREIDADAIARADLIVADMIEEVTHDTGDMIAAARAGVDFSNKLVGLSDVISGLHAGRSDASQIIVYKSVGAGIQDLAVAALCVKRARERGIGNAIPAPIAPIDKSR